MGSMFFACEHWNTNGIMLAKLSQLAALEVVKTTFSATNDYNFVSMKKFISAEHDDVM